MAGILIFLLMSFVLFFLLTRIVWVRIIKGDGFKIEIHLPILALNFIKRSDDEDTSSTRSKSDDKPSLFGYLRIITGIVDRISGAEISVKAIVLPIKTEDFNKSSILRPLRQQALLYTLIAYLKTKTEKLTLEDNAIILSPDVNVLHCYVTVKIRLYQLIYGLLSVRHAIYEEKKRTKGEGRRVRE